jgi:endonuclease-3 related protein
MFARLFAAYGPQGWWPVTERAGEKPVYRPGVYLPRTTGERDEIAFGAVLTQNTSWENVKKALAALTAAGACTPAAVLGRPEHELASLIVSSGYFRQKARRLRTLARFLTDGDPGDHDTAGLRARLLALSGVGPETADSILLYAFGRPVFVVDTYTRRVVLRLGLFEALPAYDAVQAVFEGALAPSVPLYNEYHALIVNLAKEHCRSARPRCLGCPLARRCRTGREQSRTSR